ncbi:uncharacterized protein [Malus domestica]|uniref:uncharacterized protein isoform X2 n=1 Tax=Malus domestica TaxID=3750 RepID=UPI003976D2F0
MMPMPVIVKLPPRLMLLRANSAPSPLPVIRIWMPRQACIPMALIHNTFSWMHDFQEANEELVDLQLRRWSKIHGVAIDANVQMQNPNDEAMFDEATMVDDDEVMGKSKATLKPKPSWFDDDDDYIGQNCGDEEEGIQEAIGDAMARLQLRKKRNYCEVCCEEVEDHKVTIAHTLFWSQRALMLGNTVI